MTLFLPLPIIFSQSIMHFNQEPLLIWEIRASGWVFGGKEHKSTRLVDIGLILVKASCICIYGA